MHKQKSTIQEEHNMQIAEAKLLTSLLQMEEISPHGSPLLFKLELLTTQIHPSLTCKQKYFFDYGSPDSPNGLPLYLQKFSGR